MLARTEWIDEPVPCTVQVPRRGTVRKAADVLHTWRNRIVQRRALASLTERDLRDAGLTRADAMGETAKPFWRA